MLPSSTVVRIVDELEDSRDRVRAVPGLTTAEELLQLAYYYNWDDGMDVPEAIMVHPACDLGVALHLFELAGGFALFTEASDWKYQESWAAFCRTLFGRILGGHYSRVIVPFESSLSRVERFKLQKAGVSPVLFTSVAP